MNNLEKDVLRDLEKESNYKKLLIKICKDFNIKNYEEEIKNFTTITKKLSHFYHISLK